MGEAAGGEGLRSAGAAGVVSAWVEGSGERGREDARQREERGAAGGVKESGRVKT